MEEREEEENLYKLIHIFIQAEGVSEGIFIQVKGLLYADVAFMPMIANKRYNTIIRAVSMILYQYRNFFHLMGMFVYIAIALTTK